MKDTGACGDKPVGDAPRSDASRQQKKSVRAFLGLIIRITGGHRRLWVRRTIIWYWPGTVREYLVQLFKYPRDGSKGAAANEGGVLEALLFSI